MSDDSKKDPQEDLLLDHAYDGIQEYDNPLPAWWTNLFWATFIFAIGYVFWFHVRGSGEPVMAEYRAEVKEHQAAEAKRAAANPVSEDVLVTLAKNDGATEAGSEIFRSKCGPCHGQKGEGVIGPNLTDDHWLHGKGTLMDIHGIVKGGVAAKGMPAWDKQLSPLELKQVVAYLGTIRGKNVKGKAPEGEKVSAN